MWLCVLMAIRRTYENTPKFPDLMVIISSFTVLQGATKVVVVLSRTWVKAFGQVNLYIYLSKGLVDFRFFFCELK